MVYVVCAWLSAASRRESDDSVQMPRCVRLVFNEDLLEVAAGPAYSGRHTARPVLIRCRGGVQASVAPALSDVVWRCNYSADNDHDQRTKRSRAGACQETCTSDTPAYSTNTE